MHHGPGTTQSSINFEKSSKRGRVFETLIKIDLRCTNLNIETWQQLSFKSQQFHNKRLKTVVKRKEYQLTNF
jgi:hypothetical protein